MKMENSQLKSFLIEHAIQAGFLGVGFTKPDPPSSYQHYLSWLSRGHHGNLTYLASERALKARRDLCILLPECQTIMVLAYPYFNPAVRQDTNDPEKGKISTYAWQIDYHLVIPDLLHNLMKQMEEKISLSIPYRVYTDTGPILERAYAQQAGLGWVGRNSMLIHPQWGSSFFLAELLLGLELEPDTPFEGNFCGTCNQCIDACPTGCILPDRTLDASRCLAYTTIELKTAIPKDLRRMQGSWIFGCDICQQVCPWNSKAARQNAPIGIDEPVKVEILLREEIKLTHEEFTSKYKQTAIKRTKRQGFLRNIAVAMGNNTSPKDIAVLAEVLLNEPEPLVRAHAAWALGKHSSLSAKDVLYRALGKEQNQSVLDEISAALERQNT
ncbi:MAG: tRNA epoxyqueuosine(34) reductase QueG [Anaerolineales bacterium]|nr:tRNA epoxyqueuosine(34) reductase QueG [Anaerolineales bacterium]